MSATGNPSSRAAPPLRAISRGGATSFFLGVVRGTGRQRGVSLIELVVFIVVVSFGLAGVLAVLNVTVQRSADPLIAKQALAVADALIEEITLKDFCDPTPAVLASGNLAAGSAVVAGLAPGTAGVVPGWRVSGAGVPAGATVLTVDSPTQVTLSAGATEARPASALRFLPCVAAVEAARADFDDVRDYHDPVFRDAADAAGNPLFTPPGAYQVRVQVTQPALAGAPGVGVAVGDVFRVLVTVRAPDGVDYAATGYRYNHD